MSLMRTSLAVNDTELQQLPFEQRGPGRQFGIQFRGFYSRKFSIADIGERNVLPACPGETGNPPPQIEKCDGQPRWAANSRPGSFELTIWAKSS